MAGLVDRPRRRALLSKMPWRGHTIALGLMIAGGLSFAFGFGCTPDTSSDTGKRNAGAQSPRTTPTSEPAAADLEQSRLRQLAYDRANEIFETAIFYKPDENSAPAEIISLAPLLVQAVTSDEVAPHANDAALAPASSETENVSMDAPVVVYEAREVTLAGKPRRQLLFAWRFTAPNPSGNAWRGLRMTFDADGFPAIFEALDSEDDLSRVFVSSSFEAANRAEFGAPSDGRRFASERPVSACPDVVVVRVLEDGPMPMGPFVYLTADYARITNMICRCMPSQARRFEQTLYYEFRERSVAKTLADDMPRFSDTPLIERIRIPAKF